MRKALAACLLLLCPLVFSQQTMNNEAVIKMVKAGLSDEIVLSTINASPGQYITTSDALIALKQAGVSDKVIATIVNKISAAPPPDANPAQNPPSQLAQQPTGPITSGVAQQSPANEQPVDKPRVYLQSESKGTNRNSGRDQSMEMSKDFEQDCPGVRVTINQQLADYTVMLNHIEMGFVRDNQFQIADKNGDLLSRTKEGGSIRGGVKKACQIILSDWGKK
jgi:hypothetical protein